MVIPNFPWELESEILSRVPPTSIKQLQLTCKRWYALFKDPRFIKKHLGKAETQLVLKNEESVYSFSFNVHGIHNRYDQFIEFTGILTSLKDSEDVKISEIFHCKGLLLCTTKDNRLVVWNPCTGQTKWIQSRPSSNSYTSHHRYFLGYENNNNKSCDSYKILSCSRYYRMYQDARVGMSEIYEFNSDSWRVHDAISTDWVFLWNGVAVSLKGNTYWLNSDNCIIRFDFTKEIFERVPLPSLSDEHDEGVVLSTVREKKLALLCQNLGGTAGSLKMTIWVTNTKPGEAKDLSWSEFVVVDIGKLMIITRNRMMSFLVDEENKKVMCCDTDDYDQHRTRIYIVGEDIYKVVYREVSNGSRFNYPLLFSYVPSLVQIPKRQSNLCGKRKR